MAAVVAGIHYQALAGILGSAAVVVAVVGQEEDLPDQVKRTLGDHQPLS